MNTKMQPQETTKVLLSTVGGQPINVQQSQNTQLVNLLKQSNSGQPQQIRLLTPIASPSVSGTTTFQLGNQLITITSQAKPTTVSAVPSVVSNVQLKVNISLIFEIVANFVYFLASDYDRANCLSSRSIARSNNDVWRNCDCHNFY